MAVQVVKSSARKAKPHQRYYVEVDGKRKRVPGVTSITGVMDKPALVRWANEIGLNGISVTEYVDDLASAGTCAHLMIELHLKGVDDPTKHADMGQFTGDQIDLAMNGYIKFMDWQAEVGFVMTHTELQLVHPTRMYGGTIDIVGTMEKRDNIKALVDIKTSKGIYSEHKTQVAGGYSMLAEVNNIAYDQVWILRVGRNEMEGFDAIRIYDNEINLHRKRFMICKNLYDINKEIGQW